MPNVSMFYGIKINFYHGDHAPPHFHAEYAGNSAMVNILTNTVIKSSLPKRQLKLVLAWAELNKDELMHNWELCQAGLEPLPIKPLR